MLGVPLDEKRMKPMGYAFVHDLELCQDKSPKLDTVYVFITEDKFNGVCKNYSIKRDRVNISPLVWDLEYFGTYHDQTKVYPLYNSSYYLQPQSFVHVMRARYLEAYAQRVRVFHDIVDFANPLTKEERNFYLTHERHIESYVASVKDKSVEYPMAEFIYNLSGDTQLMENFTGAILGQLEQTRKILVEADMDQIKTMLEYPEEMLQTRVSPHDIDLILTRREIVTPAALGKRQQDRFWEALQRPVNNQQARMMNEYCDDILTFCP